jgi:glycosyltransferase involved in cell wall biosynthesis
MSSEAAKRGTMGPLRVALDISLFEGFRGHESRSGIARTAEQLALELSRLTELDVALSNFFQGRTPDPLVGSFRAAAFAREHHGRNLHPVESWHSRTGLARFYAPVVERAHWWLYDQVGSQRYQRATRYSLPRISAAAARTALRIAHRGYMRDLQPQVGAEVDVFHSCYGPLPDRRATGPVPRALTIFDMIPVTKPEWVPPQLSEEFRKVIASIDLNSDWVFTISDYTRDEFLAWTGMASDRVRTVPLAADSLFHNVEDPGLIESARARYGIPGGPYILSLAAFQPRKNIGNLVRAFDRLVSSNPDRRETLVLVGSSWMDDGLRQLVASLGHVRDRIIFTGYVPDADLSAVYSGAACFVFPSLYEGFGLPLLEAMQCGVPVISSAATSLPEVGGDAAHWVDARRVDDLVAGMREVLENPRLRERLRQAGFQQTRKLTWAHTAQATAAVYREMCGRVSTAHH